VNLKPRGPHTASWWLQTATRHFNIVLCQLSGSIRPPGGPSTLLSAWHFSGAANRQVARGGSCVARIPSENCPSSLRYTPFSYHKLRCREDNRDAGVPPLRSLDSPPLDSRAAPIRLPPCPGVYYLVNRRRGSRTSNFRPLGLSYLPLA
jgi:hypothetical protein